MLFIVDFDGTVAPEDTVDALLRTFAGPEWEQIEEEWVRGSINSQQCMAGQVALVRGEHDRLKEFLESVEIDPTFASFVEFVRPFGEVVVVSDGLDYPIRHALRKAGIDVPIVANAMEFREGGLGISFPYASAECTVGSGVCKCAVSVARNAGRGMPVVLIGDGRSDQCIAREADYVFAKSTLRSICETEGIRHVPFETFADVLDTVRKWIEQDLLEQSWPLAASRTT